MGLSQVLNTAVTGLRVTQSGMSVVAGNVANAETAGYVRKTVSQVATAANGAGIGVRVAQINRELDVFVQRQLRTELSGGGYADTRAEFYQRLQTIYGDPGSSAALETVFNSFTSAVQTLTTTPESDAARSGVINAAKVLAQQLNGMTEDIQALRSDAELGLSAAVQSANDAIQQIAQINRQLGSAGSSDAARTLLLDQRDLQLTKLSQLMDIRVVEGDADQVTVFTGSGNQLVGFDAGSLSFDAHGTVMADSRWSADPTQRAVGTITMATANGGTVDLIAMNGIKSGRIAALIEMRDTLLPQAQAQLDEIAATLSQSLSDKTTSGVAATSGGQSGFDLDLGAVLDGNMLHLTYTDTASGQQRHVSIVRVDDTSALPLSGSLTASSSDQVIGVSFSGGMAAVAAKLNAALGTTGMQFSNPAGTTLRVLDDGLGNRVNVDAFDATTTTTSLTAGGAALPLFLDGGVPFTSAISAQGQQFTGYAGRIALNPSLASDPSRLVVYQTAPLTQAGDSTRPSYIYDQLTATVSTFAARSGLGSAAAPFSGTLPAFLRQVINQQGEAATTADSLKQGQAVVVNTLQKRLDETSGVSIDQEMATLMTLQTAYGANARVMTTVKDMFDLLMRI